MRLFLLIDNRGVHSEKIFSWIGTHHRVPFLLLDKGEMSMTTWGSTRTLGPVTRKEQPVGNDFLTRTNDIGTGSDYGSGGIASADGGSGSPIGISTSAVTVNVPDDCVEVVLCGSGAFLYSEDSSFRTWFACPADTVVRLGVAQRSVIYLKTASGTANVSIQWVLI